MLRIIIGKPGSGKSYYAVKQMVGMLEDWVRYEIENGEPYGRRIYTNIGLDIGAINGFLSRKLKETVDVEKYVVQLDDEELERQAEARYQWWRDIEPKAFVCIDEVHKFLGEGLVYESKPYRDAHRDWVMEHRKMQRDIVYITQHQDNTDRSVLRGAEDRVENAKVVTIPYLQIPIADVDVVKEAWGCLRQYAVAVRGVYEHSRVVFNGDKEHVFLDSAIFACYRSHAAGMEASDRPSLKLGRIRSIIWFARRHAWHLALKAVCVVLAWKMFWLTVDTVASGFNDEKPRAVKPAAQGPADGVLPDPAINAHDVPVIVRNHGVAEHPGDDRIYGLFPGGVITPRGVVRLDEHVTFEGERDFVRSVNVTRGIVFLGSGRQVRVESSPPPVAVPGMLLGH